MKCLRRLFIICLAIVLSSKSFAQTCDCTIVPYKPAACYKICTAKIIKTADTLEMRIILGLTSGLTKKLDSLRNSFAFRSDTTPPLTSYKEFLTKDQYQELTTSLSALNNTQAKYFAAPEENRKTVIKNLGKIVNEKNEN